jgi:hypothetical protein
MGTLYTPNPITGAASAVPLTESNNSETSLNSKIISTMITPVNRLAAERALLARAGAVLLM